MSRQLRQAKAVVRHMTDNKVDKQQTYTGLMGDGLGNVEVTTRPGYVYARIDGRGEVYEVQNAAIPAVHDLPIKLGNDMRNPNQFVVLGARQIVGSPYSLPVGSIPPAIRYEWFANGGGQDPLYVQLRQLRYLRPMAITGMTVQVERGILWPAGHTYPVLFPTTTIDLTSYIPATASTAALVLLTISEWGELVATKGSEDTLSYFSPLTDMTFFPDAPADTARIIAAVRVRNGQTQILEARNSTDLIDMRFCDVGRSGGFANPMTTAGDIITGGTAGAPLRLAKGTALQVLRVNASGTALEYGTVSGTDEKTKVSATDTTADYLGAKLTAGDGIGIATANPGANETLAITAQGPNLLINGGFDYYQRQNWTVQTSRANDTYGPDRWIVLTQTAAINTQKIADAQAYGNNCLNLGKFIQPQVAAQRFGFLQIVEGANSVPMRGRDVTFQIGVQPPGTDTIRCAILAWTLDINVVTSDVVLNWASTSYTAGGFFKASNLTVIATGSVAGTTTWRPLTATGTAPTNCNNLIVMVWTDQPYAQGDTLEAKEANLHAGAVTVPWQPRPPQQEIALCQRYYRKSYALDTAPGTATEDNDVLLTLQPIPANTAAYAGITLGAPMRAAPTWTIYSGYTGASGYVGAFDGAGRECVATLNNTGQNSMFFHYTTPNNGSATLAANCHYTVEAEL